MFEYSKQLIRKIENKEDLSPKDMFWIEAGLRMHEVWEASLDFNLGLDEGVNPLEITYKLNGKVGKEDGLSEQGEAH